MTRHLAKMLLRKIEKAIADLDASDVETVAGRTRASHVVRLRLQEARAATDKLVGGQACDGCAQILTCWNDHKKGCQDAIAPAPEKEAAS